MPLSRCLFVGIAIGFGCGVTTTKSDIGAFASWFNLGSVGGAGGTRTPYLFNAIEALSQMSYSPTQ